MLIECLTCSVNEIGVEGGEALYGALTFNSTLKELEMDSQSIPNEFKGMSLDEVRRRLS